MAIKTTRDLLAELKAAKGWTSDYQLAKGMGWAHSRVSHYQAGRRVLDDESAIQVAQLLGYAPGLVLTWLHAERAFKAQQPNVAKLLEAWARKVAAVALVALGVGLIAPSPAPAAAAALASVCILCQMGRRRSIRPSAARRACHQAAEFAAAA